MLSVCVSVWLERKKSEHITHMIYLIIFVHATHYIYFEYSQDNTTLTDIIYTCMSWYNSNINNKMTITNIIAITVNCITQL